MFTQPCFIRKNSPELRKKLEYLGHVYDEDEVFENAPITACEEIFIWNAMEDAVLTGFIDCGTNEELFLAIASLRDDTDKNQWFASNYFDVNMKPDRFVICTINDYKEFFGDCPYTKNYDDYHKATVEELIEHFKDKHE